MGDERPGWKRDIAVFLSGQTVSPFGSMLVQYAVLWHLTLLTESGAVLAISSVVGFLPQAVVSVFGGVWADRLDRRLLVVAADATIALTTLALALLMLSGVDDLWLIYVALGIRSAGAGVQMPAVAALLPQIVPTHRLMRVNGINASIQSALMLLAPAAAAAVYATWSIVAIFFVDVATAVVGIGLLLLVAVPRLMRDDAEAVGYLDDLVGGLRYVARHGFVRWVLGLYAVVFGAHRRAVLTPLMVVRTFGDEVWKLTVNELAFSTGMLLGGAAIAGWGEPATGWPAARLDAGVRGAVRRDGPVDQHVGVLQPHVRARARGAGVLDAVHDGAPGDGRARDAGPGVRGRRHRHGLGDADRDGGVRPAGRPVRRGDAARRRRRRPVRGRRGRGRAAVGPAVDGRRERSRPTRRAL